MNKPRKKVVLFDLWETLIFGTEASAISRFYEEIAGEKLESDQLKSCILIKETESRAFLEAFLSIVTPSNHSSTLISLKNPRSPRHKRIVERFNEAIKTDLAEIRMVPGAWELLVSLKEDYRLVLVSNLWAYQKKRLFDALGLDAYFDTCLFSCDIGQDKRDILKDIAKHLGTPKDDIIYVGRSYEYDITPAVNAGLSALRIPSKHNIIDPVKIRAMIDKEFETPPPL